LSGRYQVRIFESFENDGATVAGTILTPTPLTFILYADSAEEAEILLHKQIAKGKRSPGKVYQICSFLSQELTRSVAVALDGSFHHVFLDPASGPFSEMRRLRLPNALGGIAAGNAVEAAQA
jgi:hypothetical protein